MDKLKEKRQKLEWIPIDVALPDNDRYVLIACENFSVPCIGRYEEEEDGSGNFYEGDDESTLLSYGLIPGAWMELPETLN